jgi:RHS repeat-associated protein
MMSAQERADRKDFLTDQLGSIAAEVDQTQTRTYESRYSAYGRNNWSTGTGHGFGWVGSYGYSETGLFNNSHYVRARHYSYLTGMWTTVDPLWPREASYGYVGGRATFGIDPTGYSPLQDCKKGKSKQACFQCAYKHLQVKKRIGPLGACEAANKLCGSHIVCGSWLHFGRNSGLWRVPSRFE